jgi:hypothetical protein
MKLGLYSPAAKWVGGVLILLGGVATGIPPFVVLGLTFLDNPKPMSFTLFVLLTVCSARSGNNAGRTGWQGH